MRFGDAMQVTGLQRTHPGRSSPPLLLQACGATACTC